jgi:thiamine-phosphate pyrophosphorylase
VTPPRVILVTDPAFGDDGNIRCIQAAATAMPAGALWVELRDKARAPVSLRIFAQQLRHVTRNLGAGLLINCHPALARDVGADGVHLGGDACPVDEARRVFERAWISVATHTDDDVRRARDASADAVLVSPIFRTRPPGVSGAAKQGRGLAALRSARALAGTLRVYALGGVDADSARACRDAGADGVAVIRALLASPDPARAARSIHDAAGGRW